MSQLVTIFGRSGYETLSLSIGKMPNPNAYVDVNDPLHKEWLERDCPPISDGPMIEKQADSRNHYIFKLDVYRDSQWVNVKQSDFTVPVDSFPTIISENKR